MKCLKIEFAVIVGILAASLTIANQAGAFENRKMAPIPNCFIPNNLTYSADCSGVDQTITTATFCWDEAVVDIDPVIHQHIFRGLNDNLKLTDDTIETWCAGDDVVCCVFVELDPNPCTGSTPQTSVSLNGNGASKYRITGVECMMQL